MLNWADPPRYEPRVSRACTAGGVSGGVVGGRSWLVGRVVSDASFGTEVTLV